MKKETACGCVIFDKKTRNKVLLILQKSGNFWGFPKGHVEDGESEIETALREVKEEIGITVKILDEKYRYETNYIIESRQIDKTSIFYLAEPIDDTVELVNQEAEVLDSKWFSVDEAYDMIPFDDTISVLKKAYEDIKKI